MKGLIVEVYFAIMSSWFTYGIFKMLGSVQYFNAFLKKSILLTIKAAFIWYKNIVKINIMEYYHNFEQPFFYSIDFKR